MKILIAGDGKVGVNLTLKLSSEGHDITVIDSNKDVLNEIVEHFDVLSIQGNCAEYNVLVEAGIKDADIFIAVTSSDEINLLACSTAHGINPDINTIARIRNTNYTRQIIQLPELFPFSMMINPEKEASREIERILRYPGFLKRDTFAHGRIEIVELKIENGSPLSGLALGDLYSFIKCHVLVCAVIRDDIAFIPDGRFILNEGDRIFVTASTEDLTTLLKNIGIITHKTRSVLIAGGGRLGFFLAESLSDCGISVKIIENDKERCSSLAEQLPSATIVYGDASNQDVLERENIDEYDSVVSLTGVDEINMIISLYAKNRGVPQVITKLSRIENSKICSKFISGGIVCPKESTSNNIVRYVRALQNQAGAATSVHMIADSMAEALEFEINNDIKNCRVPLRKLKLKKNVLISCISHKGKNEIPNGDSFYEPGDKVLVVATSNCKILQFNDIFE